MPFADYNKHDAWRILPIPPILCVAELLYGVELLFDHIIILAFGDAVAVDEYALWKSRMILCHPEI